MGFIIMRFTKTEFKARHYLKLTEKKQNKLIQLLT